MPRGENGYWTLIEVERLLRNAFSAVRAAERLLGDPSPMRTEVTKIADDLADVAALAGASKRRLLEEQAESGACRAA